MSDHLECLVEGKPSRMSFASDLDPPNTPANARKGQNRTSGQGRARSARAPGKTRIAEEDVCDDKEDATPAL
jgi:hypothetical protein